jgi:hypothetical protein
VREVVVEVESESALCTLRRNQCEEVVVNRNFKVHVMGLISRLSGECVRPP